MKRRISDVTPICLFAFYGNNGVAGFTSSETTEPKIVYLPVGAILAIAAVTSGQASAFGFVILFLVLAFVVVDTIPDFLIRPYVSGNRTHVGLLMFAYILGPIAFGFYGIFLGPILLVLLAEFFRTIASYVLTGRQPHEQSSLSDY